MHATGLHANWPKIQPKILVQTGEIERERTRRCPLSVCGTELSAKPQLPASTRKFFEWFDFFVWKTDISQVKSDPYMRNLMELTTTLYVHNTHKRADGRTAPRSLLMAHMLPLNCISIAVTFACNMIAFPSAQRQPW
uniref:Uncharacterized protein n=1 Tax=Eutreptiella gymnastica TaxID=73025 RepID=A0A7S1IE86_9EUGL